MEQEIEQGKPQPTEEKDPEPESEIESEELPEEPREKRTFTTEQKLARGVRMVQKWSRELGIENPLIKTTDKVESPHKALGNLGELDDTQLGYLELRGITEEEDISIIRTVMNKTGQTLRQTLKDDYVVQKLKDARMEREVKAATPANAPKRVGQTSTNDVDYWLYRNERTGELPKDFETRAKVIEAKERKFGVNQPSWRQ